MPITSTINRSYILFFRDTGRKNDDAFLGLDFVCNLRVTVIYIPQALFLLARPVY